jgi:hypothetical protein
MTGTYRQRTTSAVLFLASAASLAISCGGRSALDPGDTGPAAGDPSSKPTTATNPPAAAATLAGTWSGDLPVSAPGIHWGPTDHLTIVFAPDGTLQALQFASNIAPPHTFGSAAGDFPLQGTRDETLTPASPFTVQVTVEADERASDHFHMRYRVVGTGDTPATDYVEDVSGQLGGGVLHVDYTMNGTLLVAPIGGTASGDLRPD